MYFVVCLRTCGHSNFFDWTVCCWWIVSKLYRIMLSPLWHFLFACSCLFPVFWVQDTKALKWLSILCFIWVLEVCCAVSREQTVTPWVLLVKAFVRAASQSKCNQWSRLSCLNWDTRVTTEWVSPHGLRACWLTLWVDVASYPMGLSCTISLNSCISLLYFGQCFSHAGNGRMDNTFW